MFHHKNRDKQCIVTTHINKEYGWSLRIAPCEYV